MYKLLICVRCCLKTLENMFNNVINVDFYTQKNNNKQVISQASEFLYTDKFFNTSIWVITCQRRIQRRCTGRAPPCLKLFKCVYWFEKLNPITHINFIVINIQFLRYVFYYLPSLQKQRGCVKGHQNNLNIGPKRRPPVLKFLDPPPHVPALYNNTVTVLLYTEV